MSSQDDNNDADYQDQPEQQQQESILQEDDHSQPDQSQEYDDQGHDEPNLRQAQSNEEVQRQDSEGFQMQSPYTDKAKHTQQQEEFYSPMTNVQTLATENEQFMTGSKMSKQSSRNSMRPAGGKNFISANKKVKTIHDIKMEFASQRQRRNSMSGSRNQLQWSQLRKSICELQEGKAGRQQDWKIMQLKNNLLSQSSTSQKSTKNLSRDYVVKHIELTIEDLKEQGVPTNNRGGTFSKNAKEKAYHMTNSSSIPMLESYKSLDIPETEEVREFPTTKGNQDLKRAMNQSNVFPKTNIFLKEEHPPEEFQSHQAAPEIVHNLNNPQVQSMRMKNYYSQIF